MKRKWEKLVADAKARGMNVFKRGGWTYVLRGKTSRSVGIVILEDDTALRTDVRLDLAVSIRTAKLARKILGL